jgi:hypothetical protein
VDIVIVGGPHSGVGKTLAAEVALRALSGRNVGAIKLTVADGERETAHDHGASALAVADAAGICGRGASCGVCETVSTRIPSRLIVSERAIRKPNTDTCRLHDAGAVAVAWVIALRAGAPDAVDAAIKHLESRGANMILIEGTTSLEWLEPKASVMVATDPGKVWKRVAREYVGSCDIVLRNRVPLQAGDIPAPPEFAAAAPLSANLADPQDPGTSAYVSRLQALCGATATPAWAAPFST